MIILEGPYSCGFKDLISVEQRHVSESIVIDTTDGYQGWGGGVL